MPTMQRLLAPATFYEGSITGVTIGLTIVMLVFAYYLGAFDNRETTMAVIIDLGFNVFIITGSHQLARSALIS